MNMLFRPIHMRLSGLALGVAIATGVSAQTMDHSKMSMPGMDMPMPAVKQKPAASKKPTLKKPAVKKKGVSKKKPSSAASSPHAMHQAAPSAMPADMPMDHSAMDHSAMGHDMAMPGMSTSQSMDHSMQGMDMSQMDHAGKAKAPTTPRTPIPALTDADRAAAISPAQMHDTMDNSAHAFTLIDRLEGWNATPGRGASWEGKGWVGNDLRRVWWRSEGERIRGRTESADLEILYGKSVSPWWDVVAGVRHDFKPGEARNFAAIGVQGLAPQKFEVAATGYLGSSGFATARLEAEYETLLTNRLILQPRIEMNINAKDDPRRGLGSGLATAEAGLRLRYEITRRFAPYIGVSREWAFGRTADFRRNAGENINDTRVVAGIRIWF